MKEKNKSTVGKKRKSRAILKHDDSSESDESVTFGEKKGVTKFDSDRTFRKRKEKAFTVSESEESDDSDNKYVLHVNKKLRNNEEGDDKKSGKASRTDKKLMVAENVSKPDTSQSKLKKSGTYVEDTKKYNPESKARTKNKRMITEVIPKDPTESLESWSMFVNFSQYQHKDDDIETTNMFTEGWNPYKASFQHVSVYLSLLKDVGELSEVELGIHKKVLSEYLPHLEWKSKDVKDVLDLADTDVKEPKNLRSYMEYTQNYTCFISGMRVWRLFVDFCQKKRSRLGRINPFLAEQTIVKEFILHLLSYKDHPNYRELIEAGLRPTENFFVHNISKLCNILGKYLKMSYCGEDVIHSESIKDLLLVGKHLDGRVFLERCSSSKLVPKHDFTQYIANHGENFWEIKLVKQILKDVSSSALDKKRAAWQLGVTEDMIDTALQIDKKDPEFNLTLELYMTQGFGSESKFWEELSTMEVLNQVRDRKVSVKHVAFMFGVSRTKILNKVGEIKSEEEINEEKKIANEEKRKANLEKQIKKPTQLEMQIKLAEDNLKNLSDYEMMRLENLKERQAMLVGLNIVEDDKASELITVEPDILTAPKGRNITVDYGKRDKSSRIKRKTEEKIQPKLGVFENGVAGVYKSRKSPEWVGGWCPQFKGKDNAAEDFNLASPVPQVFFTVKEVISSKNDYHKSLRFMNSISDEFKEVALEKLPDANLSRNYSKIADSKVSSSDIRCVDTFGDLVCYGDSSGGVGVFLDERSTTLKIHNKPVTRTVFVGGSHGGGILSSSLDGTVRLTDLIKQEVTVEYSWIQSGEKEQIGWIEPWEGTNYLMNSNRNSLKRIDLRSRKVDTLFSIPDLKYSDMGYFSETDLVKDVLHDPSFGTNIGVHPMNNNLISFCQQSSVQIFDMRNISQPLNTISIDEIQTPVGQNYRTKGVSGANWSPVNGKYFLACPIKNEDIKQLHYPYIFNSSNFEEPLHIWPPKKGKYENASFSHNYGASWCPWQEGVFFTTAVYRHDINRPEGVPSHYAVVGIDAANSNIVSEISEDLDSSKYLVECHKTRHWVVVGNARGPGDLAIYKAGE